MSRKQINRKAIVKVIALVVFIISAVYVVRYSPVKNFLTTEALGGFLEDMGFWAPVVFMVIYAFGVCLFVPGTLLGAIGAVLFGPYWGFLYVWAGALGGASAAFFIARYLGRDFAATLIGDKLKKYDDGIEQHGFATVLYLRLVYFPFTPMNFGMGLTKVRFRDYFFGTFLGIFVGTFIFIFFIGTIKDVWAGGRWEELLSWKVFLSLFLFVFSLFIPKLVKMVQGPRFADNT